MELDDIIKLKHQLDELTEKLNAKILDAEADFKKVSLGIRCTIKLSENVLLHYDKLDEWGIYVTYFNRKGNEVYSRLIEAPKTLRLYCYKHIHELFEAQLKAVIAFIERLQRAVEIDEENTSGTPTGD